MTVVQISVEKLYMCHHCGAVGIGPFALFEVHDGGTRPICINCIKVAYDEVCKAAETLRG